jgi:hypothetical protein
MYSIIKDWSEMQWPMWLFSDPLQPSHQKCAHFCLILSIFFFYANYKMIMWTQGRKVL